MTQLESKLAQAEAIWAQGPRKFSTGGIGIIVAEYGVTRIKDGLPVSRTLPLDTRPGTVVIRNGHRVREHSDGTTCDMQGRRVIATKADAERAQGITGYVRE